VSGVRANNTGLQLVVASSVYRDGRMKAKDRESAVQAVDAGIQAYTNVLKGGTRNEEAAYNYEYLVRLRDQLLAGRRNMAAPEAPPHPNGAAGSPLEPADTQQFQIRVPLELEEREKATGAGKVGPIQRKG
jgi:hypothetical protein